MKKEKSEKPANYIEKNVFANVDGVRKDGDYTSENRRFPDTWYHCGLKVDYDTYSNKLSLSSEMIANKDFIDYAGYDDEYENAYLQIDYDANLDTLEVEIYSDEESQSMQNILFDLKRRIKEDYRLKGMLKKNSLQQKKINELSINKNLKNEKDGK